MNTSLMEQFYLTLLFDFKIFQNALFSRNLPNFCWFVLKAKYVFEELFILHIALNIQQEFQIFNGL